MKIINTDPAQTGLGLFRCASRTELLVKQPDATDITLLHLNHSITEAYKLGVAAGREENNKIIDEVHSWVVCAAITGPEDMAQNFERIAEITSPDYIPMPAGERGL